MRDCIVVQQYTKLNIIASFNCNTKYITQIIETTFRPFLYFPILFTIPGHDCVTCKVFYPCTFYIIELP